MVPTQTRLPDPATEPKASLEAGKNHVRKNKGQLSFTQRAQAALITMQGGTGSKHEEIKRTQGRSRMRGPHWVTRATVMLVHT